MTGIWGFIAAGPVLGLVHAVVTLRPPPPGSRTPLLPLHNRKWVRAAGLSALYGLAIGPFLAFAVFLAFIFGICTMSARVRVAVESGRARPGSLLTYVVVLLLGGWDWTKRAMAAFYKPVQPSLLQSAGVSPEPPSG